MMKQGVNTDADNGSAEAISTQREEVGSYNRGRDTVMKLIHIQIHIFIQIHKEHIKDRAKKECKDYLETKTQ